ncbi:transporter substrate-binding domain-containing protein [Candidatus Magnetominusculus dajiuhuensis]|uniref:transporter substrate-binding domain-containing protein n=1 Tax=Candidatus Magnetominusculus dajiuhuensis TaxID=3137712 RepID=UPI003B437530
MARLKLRRKLRRYIAVGILILLIAVLFFTKTAMLSETASDNMTVALTPEEREFIKGKKVRLGVDSARPPYEFIDDKGVYSGMSAGFIETCAKRLGIEIVLVPGLNVGAAMKKLKDGEIDVIPKISPDPQRTKDMLFTRPYSTFAAVIVTRQDVRYISGVDNLEGLNVAVLKGLIVETRVRRDYPNMPLISLPDIRTALLELSAGKIDVLIDNLAIVSYNIDRLGLNNLKIAGQTKYQYDMAFGVRKDWPLMASALDKALSGMSKQEKAEITDRWLNVQYQPGINWRVVGPIAAALLVIVIFVAIWNRRLRAAVSQRDAIQEEMRQYAKELESRAAIKSHISQISAVLQKAVTNEELASEFLSFAAPLLGAAYGVLYIFDKKEQVLRSSGGYGCDMKDRTFAIGQGLVGQCALQRVPITMKGQSGCGIVINWGIGKASPAMITLRPVIQNTKLVGVIELAGMAAMSKDALALLEELTPIIAVNIEILNRNLHTKQLLDSTQQLADELNSQQRILKETETWYRDIIESLPDAILVVNQAGEIILTNLMADKIFGYGHGELIGQSVDILVPGAMRAQHHTKRDAFFKMYEMRREEMGTDVHGVTVTGVRKDGSEFQAALGLSPLAEDSSRGICVCASIKDISTLKRP